MRKATLGQLFSLRLTFSGHCLWDVIKGICASHKGDHSLGLYDSRLLRMGELTAVACEV